ncbi:hypothetical protein XHV734_3608 [Xanthomonas hortorum pv. vitians]|nr:hypothetical protein XHV734_3608 [Xanthomonas hortorum pv. vitians]
MTVWRMRVQRADASQRDRSAAQRRIGYATAPPCTAHGAWRSDWARMPKRPRSAQTGMRGARNRHAAF